MGASRCCLLAAAVMFFFSNMASLSETVPARLGSSARSLFGRSLFFSSRFLIQERRSLSLEGCLGLRRVTDVEYGVSELLLVVVVVGMVEGGNMAVGAGAGATGFRGMDWLTRG